MTDTTAKNPAEVAFHSLRRVAKATGRNTHELLVLYAIERFLAALAKSSYRDSFVLKGGMLLAALDLRRPTRDADMVARSIDNDSAQIAAIIADILQHGDDPSITFDTDDITTTVIREEDVYSGVRLRVNAHIATANVTVKLDVSFGDPIVPEPGTIAYPTLLEPATTIQLLGYPTEAVLGEKIETMIRRGDANTRERDFGDTYLIIGRHRVNGRDLTAALDATAAFQGTTLRTITEAIDTLPEDRQTNWEVYLDRNGLQDDLPGAMREVVVVIAQFADPVLSRSVDGSRWEPAKRAWVNSAVSDE